MIDFTRIDNYRHPIIIAHRGAGHKKPRGQQLTLRQLSKFNTENTTASFRTAIELGADAIECDLRQTADQHIIIHHNKLLKGSRRPISELTLGQVKALAEKRGYLVPTLKEMLEFCQGKIALDIEIKEKGFENEAIDLIRQYYSYDNFMIKSFLDNVVAEIKKSDSKIKTGLLFGLRWQGQEKRALKRFHKIGADIFCPHWRLLTKSFMARLQQEDIPVLTWTADREIIARRLINRGVAGIISNYPEKILRLL